MPEVILTCEFSHYGCLCLGIEMTEITLNCLIVTKSDLMDISIIKVIQAITINSSNQVSVLENEIQNRFGAPFNNIPLRVCQIYSGSVVERPMQQQALISAFFFLSNL